MRDKVNVTVVSTQARIPEDKGTPIEYGASVRKYPELTRGGKADGV